MSAPTTWFLTHGARALLLTMSESEREQLARYPTQLAPWVAALRRLDRAHITRRHWLSASPVELMQTVRDDAAARQAAADRVAAAGRQVSSPEDTRGSSCRGGRGG